jgi:hypothetical protein
MHNIKSAILYQVELIGTPDQVRQVFLIVCVLIRYQVDLAGGPDQVYLPGVERHTTGWTCYNKDNTGLMYLFFHCGGETPLFF